ncbi:MAG TPA: hypothetical protein VK656_04720, partial [Candidatus Acidoferrum sp.]|nr:hypothetical protein [Candidatus Acidoferrum sp.]
MSRTLVGPLGGCELVVFDKDGTLIEFHAMWGGWTADLARDLVAGLAPAGPEVTARLRGAVY